MNKKKMGLEFSESDYQAALKQIEGMLDTIEPGTPEGDKFEKLIALVEAYEENHFPMYSEDEQDIELVKQRESSPEIEVDIKDL